MEQLVVLVNNAGTNKLQLLADVDDASRDLHLGLNIRSAFQVSRAAAVRMMAIGRGGSIVHISSQMGHVGAAKRTVYCMTKHAIEGLTKAMAIELAPDGIRVNAFAPTIVETSMTAHFWKIQPIEHSLWTLFRSNRWLLLMMLQKPLFISILPRQDSSLELVYALTVVQLHSERQELACKEASSSTE